MPGKSTPEQKITIHLIEPHPGDALGSACGICYNENIVTVLHTICGACGGEPQAALDPEGRRDYLSIKRDMNIIRHEKYCLPGCEDAPWEKVTELSFGEKSKACGDGYGFREEWKEQVLEIVRQAVKGDGWLAMPTGLGHPMHALITSVCLEAVREAGMSVDRLMFYVAHPYDYERIGTGEMEDRRRVLEQAISRRLLRCDDPEVSQSQAGVLVGEIYGKACREKFGDSLEKTLCAYYVTEEGYRRLVTIFHLKCNQILFLTMEAWPFYKTGGLGEVAYGLCRALKSSVNDVRIMLPGSFTEPVTGGVAAYRGAYPFLYEQDGGACECVVEEWECRGLVYYLLKMRDSAGQPVDFRRENRSGRRFAAYCDAVLQRGLDVTGYEPTICHCNDWQMALFPFLGKTKYRRKYPGLNMIYTIHFYGYKGIFPEKEILAQLGMEKEHCKLCITCQEDCVLERTNLLNKTARGELVAMPPSLLSCMRAGIEFADAVTTVSRGYARELEGYPDFAGVHVVGIRNGIITARERMGEVFPDHFSDCEQLKQYKRRGKEALQRELGLEIDAETPVIAMVSRLAIEKGIELVRNILPFLLEEGAQVVLVGDDSDRVRRPYATYFEEVARAEAGRFAYCPFCEEIEYRTYAGADLLLMPSLSEACGTTQMNAMQFGVVPVVSMLSAFKDTVLDYKERGERRDKASGRGIGFFAYRDDCWVFLEVLKKVLRLYRTEKEEWEAMIKICSETDFSWKNGAISDYLKLYDSL